MEHRLSSGSGVDPFVENNSKLTDDKRKSMGYGEKMELSHKRIKTGDLESVFSSEGIGSQCSLSFGCQRTKDQFQSKNEESSQITEEPATMTLDALQALPTKQNTLSYSENVACSSSLRVDTAVSPMDCNTESRATMNPACDVRAVSNHGSRKVPLSTHNSEVCDPSFVTTRCVGFDLNVEHVPYSADQDPFHPYKISGHVKSSEASECGSSTGPLEEHDSFRKWNEIKLKSFLSSSHGGIPIPKQRGRKKKNDVLQQKMEIAKREQVKRFTKVAAPSGLLNGLNPGIINHVRNSKQVHAIIEALVRSKKLENAAQSGSAEHLKKGSNNDAPDMQDSGACQTDFSIEKNTPAGSWQTREYYFSSSLHTKAVSSEPKGGHGYWDIAERSYHDENFGASQLTYDREDERLKLKLLFPLTTGSKSISGTNDAKMNQASVSHLSVRAATVASQWLELIYQDIRGRLAALRRSKKRVQAVIRTELPFLLSKEFSHNKEKDHSSSHSSSDRWPSTATPVMHRTRWTSLFEQMEKTLSEEGKHLEKSLNEVKEMQLRCQNGLQCVNWSGLQIDPSLKQDNKERELSLRAAAASIYSTCNFVTTTKEDVSCF